MNYPERIIMIAVMTGVVAAGFTWFGWELVENLFALARRRKTAAENNTAATDQHEPEKT